MTYEKRDRDIKFSRRKNFFKHRISIKYLNIKDVNIFWRRSSFVFEKIERFDFIVSFNILNFTFQNFFSHIVTNRKRKHDIEQNIENLNNENHFVVDVNRDFATFFARRLKVVNSFFTNFWKFQSISRRLTFNFVKETKKKFRLTNENLNSSRKITIKDHENFRIKVNEHFQTWMKTLNRMFKFWRVTKTQRLTIKKKFKKVTIRVEKLSRLNNAQIQNIIKFNKNIILSHSQVDNFKNEIVWLNEKVKRYKNLKNQHRNKKNDLIEKIISFRVDKNALKKKIQKLQTRLKIFFKLIDSNYINDFDFENERFKRTKFQKSMWKNNFILDKMLKTLKRKNQRSFFLEMSVKQKLINITISIKITSIIVMTRFTTRDIMNKKNVLNI